jgi:hypothetical protein
VADGCDQSLRDHAGACEVCREVVAIVPLLREEYDEAREAIGRRDVPLPSAGQIWWRAAVHARADAAARPRGRWCGATAPPRPARSASSRPASMVWPSLRRRSIASGAFTARLAPAADMVMATLRAQLPIVIAVAACLDRRADRVVLRPPRRIARAEALQAREGGLETALTRVQSGVSRCRDHGSVPVPSARSAVVHVCAR